ncbi:MAG: thioredoxin family protein [Bacilli bacterium]|nr:thioredoxin family protein [Bacilli bacterium]
MKIIKIGALWCSACLVTNNALDKYIKENNNIELITLDYDFDEDEVKKYEPGEVLPVLIFEKDGKEVLRLKGEKNYDDIIKAVGDIK